MYIDFRKAFDVISHEKLFTRLHAYGIQGELLLWLKQFFTGRVYCTKVGLSFSDFVQLLSGIIQGSVIGPIMFIIFINELVDLLARFGITVKFFADDAKLYTNIIDTVDGVPLQDALNALCSWADTWQLPISIDKCYVLNMGKCNTDTQITLTVCGKTIPSVTVCKDLGITVTENLLPSLHINNINVKKTCQFKTWCKGDKSNMKTAQITFARTLDTTHWLPLQI